MQFLRILGGRVDRRSVWSGIGRWQLLQCDGAGKRIPGGAVSGSRYRKLLMDWISFLILMGLSLAFNQENFIDPWSVIEMRMHRRKND